MPPKQSKVAARCANIKNKKFPGIRCTYPAKRGDYCSRHYKNPTPFQYPPAMPTRSSTNAAKKIQTWWRRKYGLYLVHSRGLAFFNRSLCHNTTELASLGPLDEISRTYFFSLSENGRVWGFDVRTLLTHYESSSILENPYTKTVCSPSIVERFRMHVDTLRRWKQSIHFEEATGLSTIQSWNLRVLDLCLRLDMLGYRVATSWFTDLDIFSQRTLYYTLYSLWTEHLHLTDEQRERIVPGYSDANTKLFKQSPHTILIKSEMDSIRRKNINVMERLISSAENQSDRTLGAMYVVMAISVVSPRCRNAYPWLF
jgi:hypothetical protein